MKVALLVFLTSLNLPSEPARLVHQSFVSFEACERASENLRAELPIDPMIKISHFCVDIDELAMRK